jgi:hypothetical protein
MANSDKKIVITPQTGQTAQPRIDFTGGDNATLKAYVLDNGSVSFESIGGQIFSVNTDTSGDIFSVSDMSGIPSIRVDNYGTTILGNHGTKTLIGTDVDNGSNTLQIKGSMSVGGDYGTILYVEENIDLPDIYTVSDRSGVPLIRVTDEGAINLAENGGYVDTPKIRSPRMPAQIVTDGIQTVRYAGSFSSGQNAWPIQNVVITPKFANSKFLIEIVMNVNNTDDWNEDATSDGNQNAYFYGRLQRAQNGSGTYYDADGMGQTQSGGQNAHIELSPPRVGSNTTDYWSGNRYRTISKAAQVLDSPVYTLGDYFTYRFEVVCLSTGNLTIGEPRGYGGDDNYPAQSWGFTITELPQ